MTDPFGRRVLSCAHYHQRPQAHYPTIVRLPLVCLAWYYLLPGRRLTS
ncbi:hypothetical protein BH18ACT13_BH18ACT13_15700 [soil metagenome]